MTEQPDHIATALKFLAELRREDVTGIAFCVTKADSSFTQMSALTPGTQFVTVGVLQLMQHQITAQVAAAMAVPENATRQ